jgi:hypothetical protein
LKHSIASYDFYQRIGLSPLAADAEKKRPLGALGHYSIHRQPGHAPEHAMFLDGWTGNVQLMLGRETYGDTKIVVLDLDGYEARVRMSKLVVDSSWAVPLTWAVETPNGGVHYYFRLPEGGRPVMERLIWLGKGKHEEIRLLGEGKLAMAPPSTLDFGKSEYIFSAGCTPRDVKLPAIVPQWILDLPPAFPPRDQAPDDPSLDYRAKHIRNKLSLARSWGLETFRGGGGNWVKCRVPWRDDNNPSGAFNVESGVFKDFATGESLSFVAFAVAIGAYPSKPEAASRLMPTNGGANRAANPNRRGDLDDRGPEGPQEAGGPGHAAWWGGAGLDQGPGGAPSGAPAAAAEGWWEVPARVRPDSPGLRDKSGPHDHPGHHRRRDDRG